MIRANMVSAGDAIAEVWAHIAYSDMSCYDVANDTMLQTNVSVYDTNVSGNYLNVAYASSGTTFTYKALVKCKVVAIIAGVKTIHDLDVNDTFTDQSLNASHSILVFPA